MEACGEKIGWNTEVNSINVRDWLKWSSQLRNTKVPRGVVRDINKIKAVQLHVFADASNTACSAVAIAVVEHSTGVVKGLLTSKSRISKRNPSISRLELVGGQMAANIGKNTGQKENKRFLKQRTYQNKTCQTMQLSSKPQPPGSRRSVKSCKTSWLNSR